MRVSSINGVVPVLSMDRFDTLLSVSAVDDCYFPLRDFFVTKLLILSKYLESGSAQYWDLATSLQRKGSAQYFDQYYHNHGCSTNVHR